MARGIQLTRSESSYTQGFDAQYFRLRITATATAGDVPLEIFLYHRTPAQTVSGETMDVFQTVCGPADIDDYPAGAPDSQADVKRFRRADVDLLLRSTEEVEEAWNSIFSAANQLCVALDRMDTLSVVSATWAGTEPS